MDAPAPAELLPARYRAALDGIALLESCGRRHDALRVRAAATKAYSRAWDAKALRRLDQLLVEIERLTRTAPEGRGRPGRWGTLGDSPAPR